MILVGGGRISNLGIRVKRLEDQDKKENGTWNDKKDYRLFVETATKRGWRILAPYGQDYPGLYAVMIDYLAKEAAARDKPKPILVGHSAGALIGLEYVKHCKDTVFEKVYLFNCPLIYPDDRVDTALQCCYKGTENVTADTTLVMSTNDPALPMTLKFRSGFSIADAIAEVRSKHRINVQDDQAFEHNPFMYGVAWKLIAQLTTSPRMLGPRMLAKRSFKVIEDLILRPLLRFLRRIFT